MQARHEWRCLPVMNGDRARTPKSVALTCVSGDSHVTLERHFRVAREAETEAGSAQESCVSPTRGE